MKRLTALILLLLAALSAFAVQAQEALTPDTPVEGEITDAQPAVEYTYAGKAGQVIAVELLPVDVLADLDNPAIIVRGPDGTELVRYDGFGATRVVTRLPAEGTYTIVATRRDDATGTSVGEYTLTLRAPQEVTLGTTVEAEIDSEGVQYYVVNSAEDFVVNFTREGDFSPEFSINLVDSSATPGRLEPVALVAGMNVTRGMIGIIPGGTLYVIRFDRSLGSFYFNTATATISFTLEAAEE